MTITNSLTNTVIYCTYLPKFRASIIGLLPRCRDRAQRGQTQQQQQQQPIELVQRPPQLPFCAHLNEVQAFFFCGKKYVPFTILPFPLLNAFRRMVLRHFWNEYRKFEENYMFMFIHENLPLINFE